MVCLSNGHESLVPELMTLGMGRRIWKSRGTMDIAGNGIGNKSWTLKMEKNDMFGKVHIYCHYEPLTSWGREEISVTWLKCVGS